MTETTEGFRKDLQEFERGAIDAPALAGRMAALLGFVEATQRKLQAKLFELRNLFDVSRELTSSLDDQTIADLTTATLMGHLMASRCAFFQAEGGVFRLLRERGVRLPETVAAFDVSDAASLLAAPETRVAVETLAPGPLKEALVAARLSEVVRIPVGGRDQGLLALGGRVKDAALSEEECDFALTLGRQALAALEGTRLHRMRLQKERQDRELQIARGIQQGLFPRTRPDPAGFDIAARSDSCFEVGGDYYDFVPIADGRLALVVADVAGKGTPASLLMASVHASVQALAGSVGPAQLLARLNRFLFQNTQANKYVTLFYAELQPDAGRMLYVSGGHVPAFLLRRDGGRERLDCGGPALGLLEEAAFEMGEIRLAPGDLCAIVTDGATEALSPGDEEFGDDRVFEALVDERAGSADAILEGLFATVRRHAAEMGCSDDLTALILKARG